MPYVYYEELPEDAIAANVFGEDEYNGVVEERNQLSVELESANSRIVEVTGELDEAKRRFADAFIARREPPKPEPKELQEEPRTLENLFG